MGGLLASLVVARIRRERPRLLWLPLAPFPVLLAVVVVAEVFWLE